MRNRTITAFRRQSNRRHRLLAYTHQVIEALRDGDSLHLHHGRQGAVWWLSNGKRVDDEVAQLVIKSPSIVGVGDALPLGADVPPQTFRIR
jgi:hypothetical protein